MRPPLRATHYVLNSDGCRAKRAVQAHAAKRGWGVPVGWFGCIATPFRRDVLPQIAAVARTEVAVDFQGDFRIIQCVEMNSTHLVIQQTTTLFGGP